MNRYRCVLDAKLVLYEFLKLIYFSRLFLEVTSQICGFGSQYCQWEISSPPQLFFLLQLVCTWPVFGLGFGYVISTTGRFTRLRSRPCFHGHFRLHLGYRWLSTVFLKRKRRRLLFIMQLKVLWSSTLFKVRQKNLHWYWKTIIEVELLFQQIIRAPLIKRVNRYVPSEYLVFYSSFSVSLNKMR